MSTHGSIGDSTMTGFDPQNEAILSTLQLNNNYIIDDSALRRAFPDFSTGSTKSDISVELGRGIRADQKENVDPAAVIAAVKHLDSQRKYPSKTHQRRATVDNDIFDSYGTHNRPIVGTTNRRSSRFSPPRAQARMAEPELTMSEQPTTTSILLKTLNGTRKTSTVRAADPKPLRHVDRHAGEDQNYGRSDMTTISEIVTGTLQFNSRVERVSAMPQTEGHFPSAAVPVPQDQQALFTVLKLLQEKVLIMEDTQASMQRTIEGLQKECKTLRRELRKSREVQPTRAPVPIQMPIPIAVDLEEEDEDVEAEEEELFDISIPQPQTVAMPEKNIVDRPKTSAFQAKQKDLPPATRNENRNDKRGKRGDLTTAHANETGVQRIRVNLEDLLSEKVELEENVDASIAKRNKVLSVQLRIGLEELGL